MKKRQLLYRAGVVALMAVLLLAAAWLVQLSQTEHELTVAVIVSDSNNGRWISVREGMEQAAADEQVQLHYVSAGVLSDAQEAELLERELSGGADAVVLQPVGGSRVEAVLEQYADGADVMLLESGLSAESGYPLTAPDAQEVGRLLAKAVCTHEPSVSALSHRKIGVLCSGKMKPCMQKRLQGLTDALQEFGIEPAWVLEADEQGLETRLKKQQKKEPADILVALGNVQTEAAVDYLLAQTDTQGRKPDILLYGTGCSEKSVYYLDKGVISGLIVPNEFYMGYQSIREIAKQLKERSYRAVGTTIGCYSIDRENLYLQETQKLLFPIVQ